MKKQLTFLIVALAFSSVAFPAPLELSPQGQQQLPQGGWYDWGKQKAMQYIPYVPGAITGLSGASLLGLQYAKPYLGRETFGDLIDVAGLPVNAYWAAKNIWKSPLDPVEAYWGYEGDRYNWPDDLSYPEYMQQYAPYLLGTSAVLLAAPYLYRKYQEYRQQQHKQPKVPEPK